MMRSYNECHISVHHSRDLVVRSTGSHGECLTCEGYAPGVSLVDTRERPEDDGYGLLNQIHGLYDYLRRRSGHPVSVVLEVKSGEFLPGDCVCRKRLGGDYLDQHPLSFFIFGATRKRKVRPRFLRLSSFYPLPLVEGTAAR